MPDPTPLAWIFDSVPASGARLGGDPSAFVFDADLDTFVREVLQNATDQRAVGQPTVAVRFTIDTLRGERFAAFRAAFGWPDLQAHLAAVLTSAGQTERGRFVRAHEGGEVDSLRILWIEDQSTTGLTGPESGDGAYAALCRDRLFSNKQNAGAGGSFGLGKAVLWRFSRWSTVAFCSRLAKPDSRGTTRFVAKASLPWHEVDGRGYAGDGWLGAVEGTGTKVRAVSVWDDDALAVMEGLGAAPLPETVTGTAIGVIGFEEPAAEDVPTTDSLADRLWSAAVRSFWPAMALQRLKVGVGTPEIDRPEPVTSAPWRGLYQAYRTRQDTPSLRHPGDVVVLGLPVSLPAERTKDGRAREAIADLVVRLALPDDQERFELMCFRGAGMIVERRRMDRLAAGTRGFHALLVCGTARRGDATDADQALERFLRDAEPPSHDRWVSTPRLREAWKRGYAKALDGLWRDATDALRRLAAPPVAERDDGPLGLRKLFPLMGPSPGGRAESAFHFRQLQATFSEGRWQFSGRVRPNVPVSDGWSVRVDARLLEAGGKGVGALVAAIETVGGSGRLEDGVALIDAPAGVGEVAFVGRTEPSRFPIPAERACFELVVSGSSSDSRAETEGTSGGTP